MLIFFCSYTVLSRADNCLRSLHRELIQKQLEHSLGYIIQNTGERMGGRAGSVIASNGKTNSKEYHYHWVRDAALTHLELLKWLKSEPLDHEHFDTVFQELLASLDFTKEIQDAGLGGGTPKVHVDGTEFKGVNATPQNDGPALRSIFLLDFAQYLISIGKRDIVEEKILKTKILENDLKYVLKEWREMDRNQIPTSVDPERVSRDSWEEIPALAFFYNRMVQRAAFYKAATFFESIKNPTEAAIYKKEAQIVEDEFEHFWNPELGLYEFAKDDKWTRKWQFNRDSRVDVLVMLASLHGKIPGDKKMGLQNTKIQASVYHIVKRSQEKFAINQGVEDGGIMIARYPEDSWDGEKRGDWNEERGNRGEGGYPWVLATAGYAQFLAELRTDTINDGKFIVDEHNLKFINEIVLLGSDPVRAGTFDSKSPEYERITDALDARSFAVFTRLLKFAAKEDGHASEGVDPRSEINGGGVPKGPEDLTWSHVSIFSAARSLNVHLQNHREKP